MNRSLAISLLTLVAASDLAGAQTAPRWLLGDNSSLTFIAIQQGAAFEGRFESFEADVQFAPDQLATSRLTVTVDTGSVNTLNSERDEVLRAPEFFNVMRWPEARFEAASFRALGGDDFQASGELTIRNQTHPLDVPFTFHSTDSGAELAGEVVVSRLRYGIGQGEWADTTWIGADVRVLFRIELLR